MRTGWAAWFLTAFAIAALSQAQVKPERDSGLAIAPWPKANGDAANSGRSTGPPARGLVKWTFTATGGLFSSPVVGPDGSVYVGSLGRKVYALNGQSGIERWESAGFGPIWASPAIGANGLLYVGSQDGRIRALETASGEERWAFKLPYAAGTLDEELAREKPGQHGTAVACIQSAPAVGPDGTVYIDIVGLTALDGRTGSLKWKNDRTGTPWTCPALTSDQRIVDSGELLNVVNRQTGSVVLHVSARPDDGLPITEIGCFTPVLDGSGTAYCGRGTSLSHGELYAVDVRTGRIRWRRVGGNAYSSPAIGADGSIYVGRGSRTDPTLCTFYCLDGRTGKTRWERQVGTNIFTGSAIAGDGTVYAANADGHLYALDGVTGDRKWTVDLGSPARSGPAIGTDGTVYIGCASGRLYAIE